MPFDGCRARFGIQAWAICNWLGTSQPFERSEDRFSCDSGLARERAAEKECAVKLLGMSIPLSYQ